LNISREGDSSTCAIYCANTVKARMDGALSNVVPAVEDVPAHGRGVGTRWSLRSLPTLTIL